MVTRRERLDLPRNLTEGRPVGESHRQFALLAAFRRAETKRWLLAAICASIPVDLLAVVIALTRPGLVATLLGILLGAAIFAGLAIGLTTVFRPRRLARALDVYRWAAREDWLRFRQTTGRGVPRTIREAHAFLEQPPQGNDMLARIELLTWIGDYESARRLLSGMRGDTAGERFERALQAAFVEFVATGDPDLDEVREAAAELAGEARLSAEARTAVEAARHAAAAGEDWIKPLEQARSQFGHELDGFGARDIARWSIRPVLGLSLLVSVVGFVVAGAIR